MVRIKENKYLEVLETKEKVFIYFDEKEVGKQKMEREVEETRYFERRNEEIKKTDV